MYCENRKLLNDVTLKKGLIAVSMSTRTAAFIFNFVLRALTTKYDNKNRAGFSWWEASAQLLHN